MNERPNQRPGVFVAATLALDGLIHAYWATGARWPANDSRTLSRLVLGTDDVPFTPIVVGPLAALLLLGSIIVIGYTRRIDRIGRQAPHRALQAGMLAITAGFALRAVLGIGMARSEDSGSAFFWLNLVIYTPLCLALTAAMIVTIRTSNQAVAPAVPT